MSEPNTNSTSNGRNLNPFSKRSEFSSQSILLYKITTSVTWLLFLVSTWYYVFNSPHKEGHRHPHDRFWQHNYSTPFAQSSIITSIYW